MPKSREVKSAGKPIGETESKHRGNPTTGILQSEASIIHLVLLDLTTAQMVYAALRVDLGLVVACSRRVGSLSTLEDVEVVICSVATSVSFGSNGSAYVFVSPSIFTNNIANDLTKDDQVLSNTGVDNVHGTHCASSIVEHPFLVQVDIFSSRTLAELANDLCNNSLSVVSMVCDCSLRKVVKLLCVENVETLKVLFHIVNNGGKKGDEDRDNGKGVCAAAAFRRF